MFPPLLVVFLLWAPPSSSLQCYEGTKVNSWNTGYKGLLKIQAEEMTTAWNVGVCFTDGIDSLEAWKGNVNVDGNCYNITNKCYNGILYPCQCLAFDYIARYDYQDLVTVTEVTFNGEVFPVCSSPLQCETGSPSTSAPTEVPTTTELAPPTVPFPVIPDNATGNVEDLSSQLLGGDGSGSGNGTSEVESGAATCTSDPASCLDDISSLFGGFRKKRATSLSDKMIKWIVNVITHSKTIKDYDFCDLLDELDADLPYEKRKSKLSAFHKALEDTDHITALIDNSGDLEGIYPTHSIQEITSVKPIVFKYFRIALTIFQGIFSCFITKFNGIYRVQVTATPGHRRGVTTAPHACGAYIHPCTYTCSDCKNAKCYTWRKNNGCCKTVGAKCDNNPNCSPVCKFDPELEP